VDAWPAFISRMLLYCGIEETRSMSQYDPQWWSQLLATTRVGFRSWRPAVAASRSRAATAHQPLWVSRVRLANWAACGRGDNGQRVEIRAASSGGHQWRAGVGGRRSMGPVADCGFITHVTGGLLLLLLLLFLSFFFCLHLVPAGPRISCLAKN
jgi:hypothetical protein